MLGAQRLALVAIFFLSGATGLVYEVVWSRQLSLTFGVTTYAVATVLATFMGGLALGSWLLGRAADRWTNPLLAYALLEAGIGVYALLVPYLFAAQRGLYVVLRQLDLSYPVFSLGRGLLAGIVLLVPTTLMGGTFPILTRFWVRRRDEVGGGAGLLYFVNTAGAIAGCTAAGFWLIEHLGISGTNRLAAAANLAIAAGALALAWPGRRTATPAPAVADEVRAGAPASAALALACIGLSGFTALAYEVLWTRALLRFLYNSTYAFTTMLATFLTGIALGSAFYAAVLRRVRRPLLLFAILQALVGLGFAVSTVVFPRVVPATTVFFGSEHIESFRDAVLAMFFRAALVLLPATFFLGATLPLATDVSARGVGTLGHAVGRVYAVNTLGAILGSLAAAFVLIPGLGMQRTVTVLVALNFAAAAALAAGAMRTLTSRWVVVGAVVVVAAVVTFAIPGDVFERTFYSVESQKLIFYREGPTDTVGVVESSFGGQRTIIYEDRRGTAGTTTYGYNFFLGHLPMLLHPGEPRTVLHICFGVGNSLSAVAAHEAVERVDNVELSPHVVEAAHYFWTNDDVLANPKVRTVIDDGRNFLLTSRDTYDVILLEPPETFTAGVMNLYTREFYEEARARLAPDGLMMQWIPTGSAPLAEEAMLFRAFWDVFPHATAWWQIDGGCVLLVASPQPLRIDYRRLQEKMARPRIRRDLDLIGIVDADHLLSFFRFDEAAFTEFVQGVAPVTDDRTVLDFSMPRYLGSGFGLGTFTMFARRGGETPLSIVTERTRYYAAQARSVVPSLTNLGGETPEVVAARIAARSTTPMKHGWISEAKWRRP